MSQFLSFQLPTNLTSFTLSIPDNKAYFGIVFQGNIPFLIVEDIYAVNPGNRTTRNLQWIPMNTPLPQGWDEMYPAFFSGSTSMLIIQGIR